MKFWIDYSLRDTTGRSGTFSKTPLPEGSSGAAKHCFFSILTSFVTGGICQLRSRKAPFFPPTSLPVALLSVLGNASVLFSAARRLSALKAPELLTVNLAVTDIGMALSMYPLSIASAFNHAWMGGDASCLYYGLMGMIFSITSIMTLAVMGMIRFLVTGSPPRKGTARALGYYKTRTGKKTL